MESEREREREERKRGRKKLFKSISPIKGRNAHSNQN